MFLAAVLAGIFFVSRLFRLGLIPIFADEAIYIRWAYLISSKSYYFFVPLSDGKTPLFMWILAPLLKLGADPLLTGRILSVLAGAATVIGIYLLTKRLFDQKTALVAVVLTLFQPFLLFYDRLSLVDGLLTALVVWSSYLGLKLISSPNLTHGVILGLVWAAALLTKPSAALYLVLTSSFIFLTPMKKWFKLFKATWVWGVLAGAIALSIYNLQRLSGAFHMISRRSADYLQPFSDLLANPFQFLPNTAKLFFDWLVAFLGYPSLIIFGLGLILLIFKRQIKLLPLFLLTIIPFLFQAMVGRIVYPRYLLPLVPFILIITSWVLMEGIKAKKWLKWLSLSAMILILVGWFKFDYLLLTDPVNANLPYSEKEQYFYEWSSGYGLKEITDYLVNLPEDQEVLVATEGSFGTLPNGLEIYFSNSRQITVMGIGFPEEKITASMETALSQEKLVYLVFNAHRLGSHDLNRLKLIAEYPRPSESDLTQKLQLWQVLPK